MRATLTPWRALSGRIGGRFEARARGLLSGEYALALPTGEEFGRLAISSPNGGAQFAAGDLAATIEQTGRRSYRMLTGADGGETLVSRPVKEAEELRIECAGETYGARISLFRNRAFACTPGGERVARLSGSLTGRSYEVLFNAEDRCALPVAVFLLSYVATNRRRAYRTRVGGAM